ncbi:MAG: EamA family transporter [Actinobacteria bacterium]|nr:EamA family transporter [Actinomycetota bacterium]MBO0788123.1 EamA family transporter [Actinomycetota bacterium]
MVTVFALAAALLYGSADFLGGTAARRAHTLAVVSISAPAGAVIALAAALVAGGPARAAGLGWAVAGGAAGGAGLIAFYHGLASCRMSVVAPVSALVSTLLPVGVAIAAGERLGLTTAAGALVCVAAIALVSLEKRPGAEAGAGSRGLAWRSLAYGGGSGFAFGVFFLFLRNAGESGVFWPVATARLTGTAVMLGAAAWLVGRRGWPEMPPRALGIALASGVVDAFANVCYVVATRAGMFGMAVILTSLYPGITVLLARLVHGERMRMVQRAGLLLAAIGVGLVTV